MSMIRVLAGAGLAFTAAEDAQLFDDPVMQAIFEISALAAGGVAGNVVGAGVSSPGAIARAAQSVTTDPTIPVPPTGAPASPPAALQGQRAAAGG